MEPQRLKGRFIKHRTHDVNKKKKDNDDKVEDKHVYVDNDNKGKDEYNDKEKYKFKTEKTTRQAKDCVPSLLVDPNGILSQTLSYNTVTPSQLDDLIFKEFPGSYSFVDGTKTAIVCDVCQVTIHLSAKNVLWNARQHMASVSHDGKVKSLILKKKKSLFNFGFSISSGPSQVPPKVLCSPEVICRGFYMPTCVYNKQIFSTLSLHQRRQRSHAEYAASDEIVLRKGDGDKIIVHNGTLRRKPRLVNGEWIGGCRSIASDPNGLPLRIPTCSECLKIPHLKAVKTYIMRHEARKFKLRGPQCNNRSRFSF